MATTTSEAWIANKRSGDRAMPKELTDHMFAAFAHTSGSGPDPGKYTGPQPNFEKALLELEDEDPYVSDEEKDDMEEEDDAT